MWRAISRRCATGSTAQMRPAPASFEAGDGEQADGPGAEHGHGFAGCDGGELHANAGHRQRLGQVASSSDRSRRNGQQVGGRQVDEFAEEAGVAGRAQEADIGADVVPAAAAELAVIAVDGRLQRGAVARRPAGDAGAGLHHRAGRFVPQHHGVDAGRIAHARLRSRNAGRSRRFLRRRRAPAPRPDRGLRSVCCARRNSRGAISSAMSMVAVIDRH